MTAGSKKSCAVIGGGMLGLTLAYRLANAGLKVELFEAGNHIGGLTTTSTSHVSDEAVRWDSFYHVIDGSDAALLGLLSELEIADRVLWSKTETLLYDGSSLASLNNAWDYLNLPLLGAVDKFRVALNILYAATGPTPNNLDNISAKEWLEKISGRSAFNKLWRPLLESKLGADMDDVSAAFIWSIIRRFYGARRGKRREEVFGYFRGGYDVLTDTLVAALKGNGANVQISAPVSEVKVGTDGRPCITSSGHNRPFDFVVLTPAAPVIASMVPGLSITELDQHRSVRYQGVVCLSMLLSRPLGGAYMTYLAGGQLPFTTVIEMTSIAPTDEFADSHLVYLPKYLQADSPSFEIDDAVIKERFLAGLKLLYPDLSSEQVLLSRVNRARYVSAVPTLSNRLPRPGKRTSIEGLWICNSSQITHAALSVNAAIEHANQTADEILQSALCL